MYGREDPAGEERCLNLLDNSGFILINRLERAKKIFDKIQLRYLERATARKVGIFYKSGNLWIFHNIVFMITYLSLFVYLFIHYYYSYLFIYCTYILFANLGRARTLENPQIRKMHLAKQP